MAEEFDYAAAWRELARPAYLALSREIHDLIQFTDDHAAGLSQDADLLMPWPSLAFRERFAAIETADLANAARAVYYAGHWYPKGGDLLLPGRLRGIHWKFSHYADQELRDRLGWSRNAKQYGAGLVIHEGQIRVYWNSPNTWIWHEIGLVTPGRAMQALEVLLPWFTSQVGDVTRTHDRDNRAYRAMAAVKDGSAPGLVPDDWQTAPYIRDSTEREPDPGEVADERKRVIEQRAEDIRDANARAERMLWLLDHGIGTDNAIYYTSTKKVCFGWHEPLSQRATAALRDRLAGFPWEYEIKSTIREA